MESYTSEGSDSLRPLHSKPATHQAGRTTLLTRASELVPKFTTAASRVEVSRLDMSCKNRTKLRTAWRHLQVTSYRNLDSTVHLTLPCFVILWGGGGGGGGGGLSGEILYLCERSKPTSSFIKRKKKKQTKKANKMTELKGMNQISHHQFTHV